MKDRIKEYLQDKGKVTVNDLAQALGKDSSKDVRELIKTLSLMERKHQIRFE
ncbi:DNA-binding protein, partial [Streptococcus pneumoniae]